MPAPLGAAAVTDTVLDGSLLLAAPVALAAGLVSFLSPCVLPLVPGYLSYVTGMSGADLADDDPARPAWRPGRVILGSALFVLGFSAVFVTAGALFGGLGAELQAQADTIGRVLGVLTILLGLAFAGVLPGLNRDYRIHRLPAVGLAGAPLLGVLFGLGWTPCIGPTLAAVQTLALNTASAGRGALLTMVYCIGLGLPFLLTGVAYRWMLGAFAVVKRHYVWVLRIGGGMLVVLGVLLVTGLWAELSIQMRVWAGAFETAL